MKKSLIFLALITILFTSPCFCQNYSIEIRGGSEEAGILTELLVKKGFTVINPAYSNQPANLIIAVEDLGSQALQYSNSYWNINTGILSYFGVNSPYASYSRGSNDQIIEYKLRYSITDRVTGKYVSYKNSVGYCDLSDKSNGISVLGFNYFGYSSSSSRLGEIYSRNIALLGIVKDLLESLASYSVQQPVPGATPIPGSTPHAPYMVLDPNATPPPIISTYRPSATANLLFECVQEGSLYNLVGTDFIMCLPPAIKYKMFLKGYGLVEENSLSSGQALFFTLPDFQSLPKIGDYKKIQVTLILYISEKTTRQKKFYFLLQ